VPVFALLLDRDGRLLAYECEAQSGLHVGPQAPWSARELESAPCECGRPGPAWFWPLRLPCQRFFGGRAAVARRLETLVRERFFQRSEDQQHVLGGRAVTHQADAEDLPASGPKPPDISMPRFLEQEFSHFGVVHALRNPRRVERP